MKQVFGTFAIIVLTFIVFVLANQKSERIQRVTAALYTAQPGDTLEFQEGQKFQVAKSATLNTDLPVNVVEMYLVVNSQVKRIYVESR